MESRLIITLSIGADAKAMASHTHPLIKNYAKKCNADFYTIEKPSSKCPNASINYNKFQIHDFFYHFERILYIDTDVVIRPETPDIFSLVPANMFAASSEPGYSQIPKQKNALFDILGPISWDQPYFNSGVMLIPKGYCQIFDIEDEKLHKWAEESQSPKYDHFGADQPYLNYRVNEESIKIFDLGKKYNFTKANKDSEKRFQNYIIHHSGLSGHRYGEKVEQIRLDIEAMRNPTTYFMSRHFPIYRYVADRMHPAFFIYLRKKFRAYFNKK